MAAVNLSVERSVARVTLARPEVRNAFNAEVIGELREIFEQLAKHETVRAIVLAGEGNVFCGGADVNWMRDSLALSFDQNVGDAERMSSMFRAIDRCQHPVVARIQGAALGGGAGLAAVCDVAVASDDAVFGFTETKLGIIPAVISPFVLAKIGRSQARAYFLTGERFDAERAREIGLVHRVVPIAQLDVEVDSVVAELLASAPTAVAAAKQLVVDVSDADYDATLSLTSNAIARQRVSPEGQEGLRAFLERRKANFAE
ncbi:MAG: enoyl-CoA hydratase-related protein [Vulcanimicrobiaceae bacterium]